MRQMCLTDRVMSRFDVFTMCNAIFDLQAEIDEQLLNDIGYSKGAMSLVDHDEQARIVPRIYDSIVNAEPGGSGANTAQGLALLGCKACFMSCVGDDEHGQLYRDGLVQRGVRANLKEISGTTGVCLVLITPDAQRTMLTYLGQSREIGPDDVNLTDLRNSKYLYVTAYMWDTDLQKEAVLHAMGEANKAGVKVTLSLADPFCVNRHKDELLDLLKKKVDIVCGNEHEAMALTDTGDPLSALKALKSHSELAVVTMGPKGSWLCDSGEPVHILPSPPVAIDSTGAGDLYMAGLLAGISYGASLKSTGRLASNVADIVIQKVGPRLNEDDLASAELDLEAVVGNKSL